MEQDAGQEAEGDVDPGVLEGVDPLEVGGLVDGDVTVDGHADDDVDAARHERVDQGKLQVGLRSTKVKKIHTAYCTLDSTHLILNT